MDDDDEEYWGSAILRILVFGTGEGRYYGEADQLRTVVGVDEMDAVDRWEKLWKLILKLAKRV